jgi:hypothetical protein
MKIKSFIKNALKRSYLNSTDDKSLKPSADDEDDQETT